MLWVAFGVGVVVGIVLTIGFCALGFARGNWTGP